MKQVTSGYGASTAADGLRAFAEHYEAQRFAGRAVELTALDAWLEGDEQSMLVVAPAGKGKSALLWAWVKTAPRVVWVPISVRFDTARSQSVRTLLEAKLRALGGSTAGDWIDLARASSPVVIVLDGLDECADDSFAAELRELPEGVRVVVAARELVDRDAAGWSDVLGLDGATLEIGGLGRGDIATLVGDVDTHVLNEIVGLADGDPLTATLLADTAQTGGAFDRWWEGAGLDHEMLAALSRAIGPVPSVLLAEVLGRDVSEPLHAAGRFIVKNASGSVSFAHPRLGYSFEDRLTPEERGEIDGRWLAATARPVTDLEPSMVPYVLMSRRSHMVRCEADPSELAALVDRDWLAAWEDLEGGYVGFLGDVDAAWDVANAEHEGEWSDALSAMQLRLCTIKSALLSVEQAVSAQTRAAAVRLGVRGQRAAAASVGAIGDRWQRNLAIEALLPELDDRGFDLLLHALEPQRGTSLPVIAIAERLLDAGLADEARAWILEDERVRGAAIVSLIDRFDDPEPFRTAVRADLETLPDAPPEARPEGYAVMAAVLAEEERSEWLARAAAMIDEIGDENLWWDSYYGECDLRLTLVEAFIAAGQVDDARGWLDRVREDPAPFADGDSKLSIHFVEVCALLGEVPDGVLDDVDDVDRARWVLFEHGLADRAAVAESVMRMEGPALQAVFEFGDEEMCAIAARRVVELLDAYVADPDSYDAAYAFYEGADAALGAAGPYLPADERLSVLERAWSAFRVPEQPLSLYNSLNAVLGLLAATDPEPRRAIADEVMAAALSQPATLECPPLCDFASWWDAFDGGHTDYVEHVLGQKRVGRPTDWVKYLAALDEPAAALDLARLEGLTDEYGELAARCGRWEEVAQEAIATFESGEFGVWPLWHVVRHAPTPEDAARIARHAWAVGMEDIAEMGCAGDLLNALPEDEAEEVAAEILDADLMIHIFGGQLAPKARLRWVTEQLDEAETLFDRARVVQQLSRLEDDTTRQLVAEVYEAAIADLEGEGLAALQPIVRQLSLEQLEPILDALYEEPSMDLRTSVSYRLQELGAPELARWGATETEIAQLGANLRLAQTLDDVVSALADMPNATTYPWVGELIVGAGIGAEWAEHIGTLDNPSDRLVAWKHVWEHLADEEQERLWDRVHAAIDAERVGTRKARTSWFERMPREDVRRHFRLEMASLRTSSVPFVPTMYSGPLGLAAEHGRTVAGVVRWFTE